MNEREQLEQAIAALEAQRALLGDAVVNTALAPLREKLAALTVVQAAPPPGQQRKQVTVLFADVSGFTAMSEKLDAEEVTATMNALWSKLDGAIVAQGGRIDKHIGDAVMALFGAPTAREDDPERAIRAALAMQAELAAFTADSESPRLAMRIGINTGPVLLGAVGTTGEYTAMGDAVNVASRLEHAAPVGGILISHDTYRHVRGIFEMTALEPLSVKGKSEPIRVYVVKGIKPRAFRVPTRGVEGIETRTIGREVELEQLQAAIRAARTGQRAHLVSIIAEAGTGKSRLLYEFTNWLDLQPERTFLFRGRATQEMMQLPYSLIRDVFAFRFDIRDSDRAALARQKLEAGILDFAETADAEATMRAHFIGHLIGFDFSASPYLHGILNDARQIRDRAFHYLVQFFADVCRDRMTVLMLEDIHWADDGSLDLIEHVLHEQPELPLLVLGLARPTLFERRPNWGQGPVTHLRLDLRPLSDQDCRRLVAEILRKVPEIPPALQDLIVTRAEGSPFYVEELIKMLIEDGVIQTGDESWSVAMERLAQVRVPATLTGVLQARLDGLAAPERDTLQQASVVGRVFWGNVVERLHHPDMQPAAFSPHVPERLGALMGKELIFLHDASAFAGTNEYIFKHAILHDVTYESVLRRLRRAYHAQVAEALIELGGERVGEYAGRIGEHFERAEDPARAAEWYWRAGKQAQATYAPATAINYYQKALQFLKMNTVGPQPAWRFDLHAALGEVLNLQARYADAIEIYTAMRDEAEAVGDTLAQARAWVGLAETQGNHGDHRRALESAVQAEAVARQANEAALAKAMFVRGNMLYRMGEAEAALALGEQVLALTQRLGDRRQMAANLVLFGAVHYMLGHYDDTVRYFEDARAIFQELDDRGHLMDTSGNLGVIAHARGDYESAFRYTLEALEIARETGERDGELVWASNLGAARVGLGDYVDAEVELREVIRMAGAGGSWILSDTYRLLAEACLGQGKTQEALEAAQRALALGQTGEVQEYIAAAWRVLGQVASALEEPLVIDERPYTAVACFEEALRIYTEIGMEGGRARTLKEWARYELAHGDADKGAAKWREACEIYTRLGAELEVRRMLEEPSIPREG